MVLWYDNSRDNTKSSDSGFILNVEPSLFTDALDVGVEKGVKMLQKFVLGNQKDGVANRYEERFR